MALDAAARQELQARLLGCHGELMPSAALAGAMGFRTARAFQMAAKRGTLPIETFTLPGRRGRFARTVDVARWLASCGDASATD